MKHVEFWVSLARRNSCAFYIILPFRPREGWFRQLWFSGQHSFLIFLNPVAFQRIQVGYEIPGGAQFGLHFFFVVFPAQI